MAALVAAVFAVAEIAHTSSAASKPKPAGDATTARGPAASPTPAAASDVAALGGGGGGGVFGFLSLAYYRPLFDVSTRGVLRRLLAAYWGFLHPSLLRFADYAPAPTSEAEAEAADAEAGSASRTGADPLALAPAVGAASTPSSPTAVAGDPLSLFTTRPDLYGPFWTSVTLVFVIGIMSNLGSWMTFSPSAAGSIWRYDFSLVTAALAVILGSLVAVPAGAWMALRYANGPPIPLVLLICLWGYSLVHYIPAAIVAVVPSALVRWFAAGAAAAGAGLFLVRSLLLVLSAADHPMLVRPILMTVASLHAVLAVVLRLYFFSFVSPAAPAAGPV